MLPIRTPRFPSASVEMFSSSDTDNPTNAGSAFRKPAATPDCIFINSPVNEKATDVLHRELQREEILKKLFARYGQHRLRVKLHTFQ
jgi:hypothetical protein